MERTFVNDPNPPPLFKGGAGGSGVAVASPPPPTSEAPVPVNSDPNPELAPKADAGVYTVVNRRDGPMRMYFQTPDGDTIDKGDVSMEGARHLFDQSGVYDENTRTWEIPEAVAKTVTTGEPDFSEFLKKQWGIGVSEWVNGEHGRMALFGEEKVEDARAKGALERQKALALTPAGSSLRWSEAPLGKAVASARSLAGLVTRMGPGLVDMAGGYAGGAAVGGAAGLGMLALGAPITVPLMVTAMSLTGAYGMWKHISDNSAGSAYLRNLDKGFSDKTARSAALVEGAVTGALMSAQMGTATAPAIKAFTSKVLTSAPVKAAVAQYMESVVNFGAIGSATTLSSDLINNFAAKVEAKPGLVRSPVEIAEAMGQSFLQNAAAGAVLAIPGAVLGGAIGLREQRANLRDVRARVAAGELDAKTTNLQNQIAADGTDFKAVDEALKSDTPFEAGKKLAGDENAAAALHAKGEALQIKKDAILGNGKDAKGEIPDAVQKELVPIVEQINAVNELGRGMEEGIKTGGKAVEPVVPLKEPRTPAEAVERRFSEQNLVLRSLEKEGRALDKELTAINDEITTRMEEGKPTKALADAADRIAAKMRENDAKGADIVMQPIHYFNTEGEQTIAQRIVESNAHVTISAAELIRMETELVNKVAAAKESGRTHGEAYARREVGRVQAYIQELVKRADLEPAERAKFMGILRNTKTVEQLEKNYPEIRDRIFKAEEVKRAKAWDSVLKKMLKAGKTKNVGGKPQGKFGDPDTQAVVKTVNDTVKMTRSEAEIELNSGVAEKALEAAADEGAEGYSAITHANAIYRMNALRYRAGQMSTDSAAAFVSDLVSMTEGARAKFIEKKMAEREARLASEKAATKDILGPDMTPPEGWSKSKVESGSWAKGLHVPSVLRGLKVKMFDSLASLSDLLAFRSGAKKGESTIEKILRTDKAATHEQGLVLEWSNKHDAALDKAYGLDGSGHARRKTQTRLMEVHDLGTHKNAAGQKVKLEFSIDQAIKRYAERMDPTLADNFTKPEALAYTPAMEAEIFGLLKDGDKRYALEQVKLYQGFYKEANAVFRKTRGVDLPYNPWYSPIRVLGYAEKMGAEVAHDANAYQVSPRSTLGGWGITRVRHNHPLEQLSSILTMNEHIKQLARYIAWEGKVREWNSLMVNPEFKAAVTGVYGAETMDAMRLMVQRITAGTHERAIMKGVDAFISRLMSAGVVGKPIMIVKQLTSLPAFASGVPAADLHLLLAEAGNTVRHGFSKEWVNSDFVKSRGWNQFQELRAAHELGTMGQTKGVRKVAGDVAEMMATPIKLGDRSAILLGGDAMFRYLRRKGMSVEDAVAETSRIARETQSSGSLSDLSVFQSQSGLLRLFTAYKNQPVQFLRLEMSALRAMASKGFLKGEGRMTRGDAIKALAIYHFVIPMTFQAVVDFGIDYEHQKRAAFFGSFNDLPVIGQLLSNAYHILAKEEGAQLGGGDLMDSWSRDIGKSLKALADGEDVEDYAGALSLLADPAFKAMFGIPVKPLVNTATGAKAMVTGGEDFIDAFRLVAGYSPYMISEQNKRME